MEINSMKLGTAARACKGKKGHPKPKVQFKACVRKKMRSERRHKRTRK